MFQLSLPSMCIPRYFAEGTTPRWVPKDDVLYLDRIEFVGNSLNLTFVRVEFHFISAHPFLEDEVLLEYTRVLVYPW